MREQNGSYYARMGIWGEPTSIAPISTPSILDTATNRMNSVQNMFGKQYDNIIKKYQSQDAGLQNQYNQSTLQDRIGAENTKNQADMQYYPQMQQAKLAQDQQTVNEIMARTGLNQAQATESAARTGLIGAQTKVENTKLNPMYDVDSAYKAYNDAPAGSPQKSFYAAHLAAMISGKSGGAAGQPSPLITGALTQALPGFGNAAAGYLKDTRFGSQKSGAGGTYVDQQTGQVVSTPTNANTTKNQAAIQAIGRVQPLLDTIRQNLPQFQGASGKAKLLYGDAVNYLGGNSPYPGQQAKGEQAINLASESMLKGMGLNVTDESLNTMKEVMRPKPFETQQQYTARIMETAKTLQENAQQSANVQAQGYNVTPQSQSQDQGQNDPQQQQKIQQLNTMAQAAIQKGADPKVVQKRLQEQMQRLQGGGR